MLQQLEAMKLEAVKNIQEALNEEVLRELEIQFLGRKSELNNMAKNIASLSAEERPQAGQLINQAKVAIENAIELKRAKLEGDKMDRLAIDEWIDVSLPVKESQKGNRHPISSFIDEIVDVFGRLGFNQADGPEIESEWYNFTALNLNADHPAREMQDTFFVKDLQAEATPRAEDDRDNGMVLRTQTSSMQIRYMQANTPPLRVIAPGKVYRKDHDATHSPMFHQVEGLLVDKAVSLRNLKGVLTEALRELLNRPELEIRFRLSYFPFTEPSLELDIHFPLKGKEDYWLEVGGCGMVHPNVLKNGGVDPEQFNGFAFGLGIDRLVMIKHNIKDLRLFFENDVRFLEQF